MGRDEMRAADSDRQRVAEALRQAVDEGRLDLSEYDERLQRTYTAKTYGELDGLLVDLPTVIPPQHSQVAPLSGGSAAADAAHPNATRRWLVATWDDYAGTVAVTIGIWAVICVMSQDLQYFWPGWVAGPWGVYLLWETIRGLSSGEPQRWAVERDRKRAEKLAKRQARADQRALGEGEAQAGGGRDGGS